MSEAKSEVVKPLSLDGLGELNTEEQILAVAVQLTKPELTMSESQIDLTNFDTVQVTFNGYIKPEGTHRAYLHTRNGFELSRSESKEVIIEFVSAYLERRRQRWNILLDGHACIMTRSPEEYRTVCIANLPHFTGQLST
jgi:hypothetical protein